MFGGGHAVIPMLKYEVVSRRGWLSEQEFLDLVATVQSIPGPVSVNAAAYIGYRAAGLAGSAVAVLALALPGVAIVLAVAAALSRFYENYLVRSLLSGVRGAALGLIAAALLTVARGVLSGLGPAPAAATVAIAVAVFAGVALLRLDPVAMVALAAAAGLLLGIARVW